MTPRRTQRIRQTSTDGPRLGPLIERVRGEYLEMPGLALTAAQAQRLWALEGPLCEDVLRALVSAGFLRRTERGYLRRE